MKKMMKQDLSHSLIPEERRRLLLSFFFFTDED